MAAPTDPIMKIAAQALYDYSALPLPSVKDNEIASSAWKEICETDMTLDILISKPSVMTILATAIDQHQLHQIGDVVEVDMLKSILSKYVNGYKPIYGLLLPCTSKRKNTRSDSDYILLDSL